MENQQKFNQWIRDVAPEQVAKIDQESIHAAFAAAQANSQGIIGLSSNNFLTKAGNGYIAWRGRIIEHYSFKDREEERAAAALLSLRCLIAEGKGFPVTGRTTSRFEPFVDAPKGTPWVDAMLHYYAAFADVNGVCKRLILTLPGGFSVAMSKAAAGIVQEFCDKDGDFGPYHLFHKLQNRGLTSISGRIASYGGFVHAMEQAGITPEDVSRVLNADYSDVMANLQIAA